MAVFLRPVFGVCALLLKFRVYDKRRKNPFFHHRGRRDRREDFLHSSLSSLLSVVVKTDNFYPFTVCKQIELQVCGIFALFTQTHN